MKQFIYLIKIYRKIVPWYVIQFWMNLSFNILTTDIEFKQPHSEDKNLNELD